MTNHTPGPWTYLGCEIVQQQSLNQDQVITIARCNKILDAKLISSAPDMFKLIKELEESSSYWSEYDVPIGIADRISELVKKIEK